MVALGRLKRGDTFSFCVAVTSDDEPATGIASGLRSQVRKTFSSILISELSVVETSTSGTYMFRHDGSTQDWPLGQLLIDVEYTNGGIVVSSDTMSIEVIGDVTHDDDE